MAALIIVYLFFSSTVVDVNFISNAICMSRKIESALFLKSGDMFGKAFEFENWYLSHNGFTILCKG